MKSEAQLLRTTLENAYAPGVSRFVSKKAMHIRVLWLLIWLLFCAFFLRQLILFINKLDANEVTTTLEADALLFDYPDLYLCYDNPMSGSRHLTVGNETAAMIGDAFKQSLDALERWCQELGRVKCRDLKRNDSMEVQMNSLPYQTLVDELAHSPEMSIFVAELVQTNGLVNFYKDFHIEEFYHPSHLRCYHVSLNDTHKEELKLSGPDDSLYFLLMMDAPDQRMGQSDLPVVKYELGDLKAPYWALDKKSLDSRVRGPTMRVYITRPGHYPSNFDEILVLEAGKTYEVELEMREDVHKENSEKCTDDHPQVQIVNPYDNSAYNFAYDYGYCYNRAVQEQFKRELNATCAYLPHPWPPGTRSLYNLTSGWGSMQDVRKFLEKKDQIRIEEPMEACANQRPCTERTYTPTVESTQWPSPDSIDTIFNGTTILDDNYYPDAPGLKYLRQLWRDGNSSQMAEYIRANFLQLKVSAKRPTANRIIFLRAYSFESFVADIGGILGIYLGMSLLTVCEVLEFFHDLVRLWWTKRFSGSMKSGSAQTDEKSSTDSLGTIRYM